MSRASVVTAVFKRELKGYFATPIAYVFIVIFLVASGWFTFFYGGFYETGQADLGSFFYWHPWLYLLLCSALSMRLWAEERKSGSIELLMTLPLESWQAVTGKFLAAWAFTAVALTLTFPIWITVNYLGDPDNGVVVAGYVGSILMAGGFLAVGATLSAATKNQVIAFILSVVTCFALLAPGLGVVQQMLTGLAPQWLVDGIAGLSFQTHFEFISKGVIDLRDLIYFGLLIGACLYANALVLELKKAD
jgi:ABC-2 type transport system permease protein